MPPKVKKRLKIAVTIVFALLLLAAGAFYVYTLDYYRADEAALQAMAGEENSIVTKDKMWIFYPEQQASDTALIFYPGGKVEAAAYAPLLKQLSQQGITCVLMQMPFNLAVFDMNAADRVFGQLPEVKHWYIGGHSLGGAMASSYTGKNAGRLEGMILLGAYSVGATELPTLAIYGSEDMILNTAKLEDTPNQHVIEGGNHAYFGNYGEQDGDGAASITREEQQRQAVENIMAFILDEEKR
ncbi:alpha/beta hydrolase [Paenibacillus woosongensis]|uniref:Carboxymethylenebutenolidase n=1 Tax=Paenibacillus woosongensis TaxID=307580 RepID=A0ABQ4MV60_9BACL|nr:alpha/beta hydrolase [Paenibacillus woosongensis]GIP59819.1 carboxymethylenebutenolidase [Paenibacillus woosongensis]